MNKLDRIISSLTGVTGELEKADSPEDFISKILGGEKWQTLNELQPLYHCGCTKERFEKALISWAKKRSTNYYQRRKRSKPSADSV